MNKIERFIEPSRLLLVWQRPMQDDKPRHRRVVGEITRDASNEVVFRYLDKTEDFLSAMKEGFLGYPAFRLHPSEYKSNVLYAFVSRMTSRKRSDFPDYLESHRLPADFSGSDFSLLAHTGARLPGDGFEVMADFSAVSSPFDMVIEVAGTRHQRDIDLASVTPGDDVQFVAELDNVFDENAVAVVHPAGRLGYIPKPYCAMLHSRFVEGRVTAKIDRLNGRPERRLIYLLARFE